MPKPPSSISERSPLSGVELLFQKTAEKPVSSTPASPTQAPTPENPPKSRKIKERVLIQTTVRLYDDQLVWLENLMYKAKRNGSSTAVSNSSLLRSLLELCHEHNLSLRGIDSDKQLKARLKKTFNLD